MNITYIRTMAYGLVGSLQGLEPEILMKNFAEQTLEDERSSGLRRNFKGEGQEVCYLIKSPT